MFGGQQCLNCVRSEIHNVLSTMRRNGRWASEERFQREIPLQFETPLIRSFKTLHDYLQAFDDINDVDAVAYLQPFLDVVSFRDTNGAMTGRALSSINKFLLYGSISQESPRAREAMNIAVVSVVECKFESTNAYSDEVVLMQLLEVLVNLIRCPAGPYISDINVWKMIQTCFRLKVEPGTSVLLRSTAGNSLTHLILTMFTRSSDLITPDAIMKLSSSPEINFDGPADNVLAEIVDIYEGQGGDALKQNISYLTDTVNATENGLESPDSQNESDSGSAFKPITSGNEVISDDIPGRVEHDDENENVDTLLKREVSGSHTLRLTRASKLPNGYGLPVLVKVLEFLSDLTDPVSNSDPVRKFALQLINIILETAGECLGTIAPGSRAPTPLVAVLQGDLCKFLLQNSQSEDLSVLSLTLRVVFNLFNAMKGHLKVQLEVFLISVHLRIAESTSISNEHKELALESLLDFCREPAMMLDLYTNYDCDVRCTNLFETLCKCLCRCAVPISTPTEHQRLTSLHLLALEGVLAVVESIARRCSNEDEGGNTNNVDPVSRPNDNDESADAVKVDSRLLPASSRTPSPAVAMSAELRTTSPTPSRSSSAGISYSQGSKTNVSINDDDTDGDPQDDSFELGFLESARERTANVLRLRKQMKRRLMLAAKQFNKHSTKKYWIEYAQDLGVLPQDVTPEDIARFFLNTPGLDKAVVGDYISDGPKVDKPFNHQVLKAYIKNFNFKNMRIDQALRVMLESFRLPGEAQKVDRLMEEFGNHLYKQSQEGAMEKKDEETDVAEIDEKENMESKDDSTVDPEDSRCGVFKSPDAAFTLAFSIIMLHTDLHNAAIKEEKKMSKEAFVRNNRGINEGSDFPRPLLESIYDSIKTEQIRMLYDPHSHTDRLQLDESFAGGLRSSAPTWDNVLRHSEVVDEASFTPSSLGRRCFFRAGVHERDMFTIIFDSAINAFNAAFELSMDGKMVARVLEGYRNLAKIAVYFDMIDTFNHIIIRLCKYFAANSTSLSDASLSDGDVEGLTSLKDATVLSYNSSSTKVPGHILAASLLRAELYAATPPCRSLLTFRAFLSLAKVYGNHIRWSWKNVIRSILILHESGLLPHAFVELDDVADAKGHALPTTAPSMNTVMDMKKKQQSIDTPKKKAAESNDSKGGGVWNTLTSFLWSEPESTHPENQYAKKLVRDTVGACRMNSLFYRSKHLNEDSLIMLVNSLSLPVDDSERNIVLCIELLTEVALSNHERIERVWPHVSLVFYKTMVNAGAVSIQLKSGVTASSMGDHDSNNSSSTSDLAALAGGNGKVSLIILERCVVNLLRISIRLLEKREISESILETLEWLAVLPEEAQASLCPRVGRGINTVLKFNASNINSKRGWDVICSILQKYSCYAESVGPVWNAVVNLVDSKVVKSYNVFEVLDVVNLFIRTDSRAAVPPIAPVEPTLKANSPMPKPTPVSPVRSPEAEINQGAEKARKWAAERAARAVDLFLRVAKSVYDDGFTTEPNDFDDETRSRDNAGGERSGSVEDACLVEILIKMKSMFSDSRAEVQMATKRSLEDILWSPPAGMNPRTWLDIFRQVLIPLVDDSLNRGEEARLRASTLLARAFLQNVVALSKLESFNLLWLRVINILGSNLTSEKADETSLLYVSSLETLKNLIMVMHAEGLFDRSSPEAGQTVWELTWDALDSHAPGVRAEIESVVNQFKTAVTENSKMDSSVDNRAASLSTDVETNKSHTGDSSDQVDLKDQKVVEIPATHVDAIDEPHNGA